MPRNPGQVIWYIDEFGNVKTGLFSGESWGNVFLDLSNGGSIIVREINTFNTEVAAQRAAVNRVGLSSGTTTPTPPTFNNGR